MHRIDPYRASTARRPSAAPREASAVLFAVLLFLAAGLTAALAAQPAPETAVPTREQQERFLATAEILDLREVGIGVTGSSRATLSDGSLTHDAHIQTVDISMQRFTAGAKSELNFRDYWGFNIAAYRLDKLLDLRMVPASVERTVEGKPASVTWWVDDVLMSMDDFQKGDRKPPGLTTFDDQRRVAWAFQQLILNRDPNLNNSLIDRDWKVWIIDFTRAFRQWKKLDDVKILTRVSHDFLRALRALDLAAVERELGPYLTATELKGLAARREKLLGHYDALIKKHGEVVVLIDRPGR